MLVFPQFEIFTNYLISEVTRALLGLLSYLQKVWEATAHPRTFLMLGFLRDTTGAKTGAFEITKSCVNSKLWEHGIKLLRYARGHSTSKCEVNSRRPTWFQNTVMLFFRNVSRCC